MFGLPKARLLANELLKEWLNKHGYKKLIFGQWKHRIKMIAFIFIVNDFGEKFIGKKHAEHLMSILK